MAGFFSEVPDRIEFGGLASSEPLTFKVYEPDRLVLGTRMADHLRIAVCLWHSFNWAGSDVFGAGTFDRPWLQASDDPMRAARAKLDAAFEFIEKLGAPFFCFHDHDVAPEGRTFAESRSNLDAVLEDIERHMARTGARLLWGTANLFSHPRYAAGAATNPDPEVFAYAAAQVKVMLEATQRLGGVNYVLWGGREGYETLLNTDISRETAQLARFLTLVAEHKHKIGFEGTLLHRAKAAGADEAPVRLRLRHGARLPRPPRPGGRVPREHRGQPRNPGRAQLPSRGGHGHRAWHLRQRRRQPRRLPERLGHRPVPELRGGARPGAARDPAGGRLHDRRLQLRHEAASPEPGSGRPVPRPHRRHGHAGPRPAGRRRDGRAANAAGHGATRGTPAGAPSSGRRSCPMAPRSPHSRSGSRRAPSTHDRSRAGRSCSRTS